ncbi:Uncharacterized protein HZ326_29244 [Fusarium oxysporum f. sp. albedinis]|nr:Uncharacterized protein HZ326_29244 [Fusarium oxysporum f. sp. albedinis]
MQNQEISSSQGRGESHSCDLTTLPSARTFHAIWSRYANYANEVTGGTIVQGTIASENGMECWSATW